MKFENPYLTDLDKIELLQKWILVHSFIYYELNDNIATDEMFDNNCKQLKSIMLKAGKEICKRSKYYLHFKGYQKSETNSTYYIINRLNKSEQHWYRSFALSLIRDKQKGV